MGKLPAKARARWSLVIGSLLSSFLLRTVESIITCNETYNPCEELLWAGSECRDGVCSNPFEKGCLNAMMTSTLDDDKKERISALLQRFSSSRRRADNLLLRVCNSDDLPTASAPQGLCVNHSLSPYAQDELFAGYSEIRILSQNWESAYFASWILQIILSELLQVPATIESGSRQYSLVNNFYDPWSRLAYGKSNDWEALQRANQLDGSDCTKLVRNTTNHTQDDDKDEPYQSCGHVITEFWNGNTADMMRQYENGVVEKLGPLGAIGQQAIFVTKFTAEADPTILNLHGIQGEANRHKLAATFKRPTTWRDYCLQVSTTNCTLPDAVAQRAPFDESEYDRMHVQDLYTGHFRATDSNNCTAHPDSCTGHIADFPCGWISFVVPQMYHNNIALQSDGAEPGSDGYSYQQLSDMWAAANATKSNLVTMWWTPEAIHTTYLGSQSEMQKISLTWPTQECSDNRINSRQRCAYESLEERVGKAEGSCDEAPQMLHKVVVKNLYAATYNDDISDAKRSPGYDTIKAFSISELQVSDILRAWINRGMDKYGFDQRLATCQWVVDNLDHIESLIPRTYPRVTMEKSIYDDPLMMVALAWGCLATLLTIVSACFTYIRRTHYAIRYAQVEFLLLLLFGLLLINAGAVMVVTEPSSFTCPVSNILIVLGYTIQLAPTVVKVSAIHRLMKAAERLQRLEIPKMQLFGTVTVVTSVVVIFLVCWSVFDPRHREYEFFLTGDINEEGATIVTMEPYCTSSGAMWNFTSLIWFCTMMVMATVLAFKTRNIREEFNESKTLGLMVYAHFLFLILLVATMMFHGALSETYLVAIRSMIYSTDSIVTILIYFLPKFTAKKEPTSLSFNHQNSGIRGSSRFLTVDGGELERATPPS